MMSLGLSTLPSFIFSLSRQQSMIIEDKIRHSLIKASQLMEEKEDAKYIISHLYTAAKLMYDNSDNYHYESSLAEKLNEYFRDVYMANRVVQTSLDQVHLFMAEEIEEILKSQQQWLHEKSRRFPIFESVSKLTLVYQDSQMLIQIPQETYFMGSSSPSEFNQAENNQNPSVNRQISLEAIPSFLVKQSDCCTSMQRVKTLYNDHKLDEAYHESNQCRKKVYLADPNLSMPEEMKALLKTIEDEYQMMTYYYQFFDEPGYTFDKEQKGVTMHYKMYEQAKEVSVRVQAELDISIQNFLCIVSEIDLFQEYIPFSYDTQTLKVLDRNKKIGVSKVYLPLLSDRIAYFYAAAYDRLSTHNSIFFFSKTITSDRQFQKKIDFMIEKDSQLVELSYRFYIMQYIPVNPNRGKIRLSTNVDMKLNFLPFFVINKTCRIFAFDYFQNLMKVNREFKGSKWQQKMKQNQNTYSFFRERIRQYLQEIQ